MMSITMPQMTTGIPMTPIKVMIFRMKMMRITQNLTMMKMEILTSQIIITMIIMMKIIPILKN